MRLLKCKPSTRLNPLKRAPGASQSDPVSKTLPTLLMSSQIVNCMPSDSTHHQDLVSFFPDTKGLQLFCKA